ncbi:MAG: type II toxin-antitoxin system HipA family toxin [Hyphomicrobiaceae bacterium]|nr:type II toxin-antitoxin system HipA family toxin [Hyphomicrobiaceae bacterium]
MTRKLLVYVDLGGKPIRVGQLWTRAKGKQESASFQYDPTWLRNPFKFALGPTLPLGGAALHTRRPLFGAFSDSAPDSWGRRLMRLHEREDAKKEGRDARTLMQVDYLAGVDDETRMGALRYKNNADDETFQSATEQRVPPLVRLRALLNASSRVAAEKETRRDIQLLLKPGSALGGARPKATIRDTSGRLLLAKFPKSDDRWPWTLWEDVALGLAGQALISVPEHRIGHVLLQPVLMLVRFDRGAGSSRIPFLSAMTALDATDNDEGRSYLEILDFIRQEGADPQADARQLWRRMVFNVLISNTDDHPRNHGFLRTSKGWVLAPAYDLNPAPDSPRVHSMALNEIDPVASLDTLLSVAPSFGISRDDSTTIVSEVAAAVSNWRNAATERGLTKQDQERMEPAFEHDDLRQARKLIVTSHHGQPSKRRKGRSGRKAPRRVAL